MKATTLFKRFRVWAAAARFTFAESKTDTLLGVEFKSELGGYEKGKREHGWKRATSGIVYVIDWEALRVSMK